MAKRFPELQLIQKLFGLSRKRAEFRAIRVCMRTTPSSCIISSSVLWAFRDWRIPRPDETGSTVLRRRKSRSRSYTCRFSSGDRLSGTSSQGTLVVTASAQRSITSTLSVGSSSSFSKTFACNMRAPSAIASSFS